MHTTWQSDSIYLLLSQCISCHCQDYPRVIVLTPLAVVQYGGCIREDKTEYISMHKNISALNKFLSKVVLECFINSVRPGKSVSHDENIIFIHILYPKWFTYLLTSVYTYSWWSGSPQTSTIIQGRQAVTSTSDDPVHECIMYHHVPLALPIVA